MEGVLRAIIPGLIIRNYLEFFKDLSLDRLEKILRRHYGVTNTAELYQSLASICAKLQRTTSIILNASLRLETEDTLCKLGRRRSIEV